MAGEQLRVTEGKEQGKLLGIDADLLIGRLAPEDEGRLGGDPEISRRHAASRGVPTVSSRSRTSVRPTGRS